MRLGGPALTSGGLLWITVFVIFVAVGATTGKFPQNPGPHAPVLVFISNWLFALSILILDLGQVGVFARLEGRARGLGITGVVFTLVSMIMLIINMILFSGITGSITYSGNLTGFGAMATTIGAAFLGWAALRAQVLPRWVAWSLIAIGLTTIPILFATPLPIGPDWATDMLAFLTSGIMYAVVGTKLLAAHKHADVTIMDTSTNTMAQAK
jgi:hypothetical protein